MAYLELPLEPDIRSEGCLEGRLRRVATGETQMGETFSSLACGVAVSCIGAWPSQEADWQHEWTEGWRAGSAHHRKRGMSALSRTGDGRQSSAHSQWSPLVSSLAVVVSIPAWSPLVSLLVVVVSIPLVWYCG